jgi:hypothetical protein
MSAVRRWLSVCAAIFAVACVVLCLGGVVGRAQGPLYPRDVDRFGVGVGQTFGIITDYDVESLHAGWYSDWGRSLSPLRPGGIEYAQLVNIFGGIHTSLAELGPLVDANPGALWLIGNEPECIYQGDNTPQQYADGYHALYTFIKGRDPTAQVAAGGVVEPTPLRLKWLDQVLAAYQTTYGEPLPADAWHTHVQILREKYQDWGCGIPRGLTETQGRLYEIEDNGSVAEFTQLIVELRTWMRDRGQREKPLFISEYGVLFPVEYGYTADKVNAFMNGTFDYLLAARDANLGYSADENRLVQRWLWYSLNDQPWTPETQTGYNGALFDYRYPTYPGLITPFGINFRRYTDALMPIPPKTVTLQQGQNGYTGCLDTYISQASATTNYCNADTLRVGNNHRYAGLVHFDLSSIPTNTAIISASMELYATALSGGQVGLGAYMITPTTEMCQATWNVARTGQNWGTAGADNLLTDRRGAAEAGVTTTVASRWYSLDITSAVQEWMDGRATNNGLLLRQTLASTNWASFASAQYADASVRPRLVIKYRTRGSTAPVRADVDGDGKTDLGVYGAASAEWWVLKSGDGYASYIYRGGWGGPGYTPVSGDYDGDGKADLAVYGVATGEWWILKSSDSYSSYIYRGGWGGAAYTPVPGDFDGDGRADLAVYGAATGEWWILKSSDNYATYIYRGGWGGSGYTPVSGDFDGDGKADLAAYGTGSGDWWILKSGDSYATYIYRPGWGGAGYTPVPGDYDGDSKTDLAVYGTSNAQWWILKSSDNYATYIYRGGWGGTGYTAVPGDFDGDGKADLGVYGASGGEWWILKSSDNYSSYIYRPGWGGPAYQPL